MFSCLFVTFPYGGLGQVWYLIVSIPDHCLFPYFNRSKARSRICWEFSSKTPTRISNKTKFIWCMWSLDNQYNVVSFPWFSSTTTLNLAAIWYQCLLLTDLSSSKWCLYVSAFCQVLAVEYLQALTQTAYGILEPFFHISKSKLWALFFKII